MAFCSISIFLCWASVIKGAHCAFPKPAAGEQMKDAVTDAALQHYFLIPLRNMSSFGSCMDLWSHFLTVAVFLYVPCRYFYGVIIFNKVKDALFARRSDVQTYGVGLKRMAPIPSAARQRCYCPPFPFARLRRCCGRLTC